MTDLCQRRHANCKAIVVTLTYLINVHRQINVQSVTHTKLDEVSVTLGTYSRLPKNRPPWNKRPGWKIVKHIVIVLPGIIVLGGIFKMIFCKMMTKLAKKLFVKTIFIFLSGKIPKINNRP